MDDDYYLDEEWYDDFEDESFGWYWNEWYDA